MKICKDTKKDKAPQGILACDTVIGRVYRQVAGPCTGAYVIAGSSRLVDLRSGVTNVGRRAGESTPCRYVELPDACFCPNDADI